MSVWPLWAISRLLDSACKKFDSSASLLLFPFRSLTSVEKFCSRQFRVESEFEVLRVEVDVPASVDKVEVLSVVWIVELPLLSSALARLRKLCSRPCRAVSPIELAERDPKKVPACLTRIERENSLINYLIGELLTLSRLGSNAAYSLEESVAMSDLLPVIADDAHYEAQAAQRNVELSGDYRVTVKGSAELLSRAIENVIRNAVRHTAVDSTVHVNAVSDLGKNTLHICVDDQGPGVPHANLDKIFEPFFQSGHAGNDGESHGLGLAITRSVVTAHGGSVYAMNRAEGGMRVGIVLPLISGFSPSSLESASRCKI